MSSPTFTFDDPSPSDPRSHYDPTDPRPRPPESNPLGIVGFVCALLSLCTFGLLAPVALIICLIALNRTPRTAAVLGTFISGLATVLLVIGVILGMTFVNALAEEMAAFVKEMQFRAPRQAIRDHWEEHGQIPDEPTAKQVLQQFRTFPEDQPFQYQRQNDDAYVLVDAGQDGQFGTADDLRRTFNAAEDEKLEERFDEEMEQRFPEDVNKRFREQLEDQFQLN